LRERGKARVVQIGYKSGMQRELRYLSSRARGYITRSGDKRDILEIRMDKKGYARV